MAEALFRRAIEGRDGIRVASAGMGAVCGMPPSEHAVVAMRELGLDIRGLSSRPLTHDLAMDADYIIGMTRAHVDAVASMYPQVAEKTFLLREFDSSLKPHEQDIQDPIGGDYNVYVNCRDQIRRGIEIMLKYFDENGMMDVSDNESKEPTSMVIGADHRGYELKEEIKKHSDELGLELTDAGAFTEGSSDYPDTAWATCRQVLDKKADFGVLICFTGLGMSIAANKIPGIRAALVYDEEMAALAREHNNANILCLSAKSVDSEKALAIINAYIGAGFEGGRHQRRLSKMCELSRPARLRLWEADQDVAAAIESERRRQQENIELVASENFTSPAVMEAQGSVLTNKYAEGYPGKRWYGGCEHIDVVEQLAIDRAKQLFGAEHANVQPHSGSTANMIVYFAVLKPGDTILTMDLSHGGHLTHGNKANFSGKFFNVIHYGVRKEDELIDYDQLAQTAREHKPKMITVGASAYPRVIDFARMSEIAREIDAYMMADIAHIAGLIAAGEHPSPVPHADFVTTTTHKTLRGPRGGLVLCPEKYAKKIDSQTFPGIQGGPLEHVIAGKAVCLQEALKPEFKSYQKQILKNAKALAEGLTKNGFRLVSGGTDNHLLLVDVGMRGMTGKECQIALDEAGITLNKNAIPFETRSPFQASGIRMGTPAVTTRGMKELEMLAIADMISEVLMEVKDVDKARVVRERVKELTGKFPLPY